MKMTTAWDRWCYTTSQILPSGWRRKFAQMGLYAGKEDTWSKYIGLFVVLSFFVLAGAIVTVRIFEWEAYMQLVWMLVALLAPFTAYVGAYLVLYFAADKRTTQVENVLPDALQLIAANLRAGMTPFHAVRSAATDDFGPLGQEFDHATSQAVGKISFARALKSMTRRVQSAALQRSIKLFTSSLKSGGKLADLLEGLASDITQRRSLKKEMVSNTMTNTMFIMFTIVIGAPLLLAISIFFVGVITDLQSSAPTSGGGFGLGMGGEISITVGFLIKVSYVLLTLTSILACMFIGSMIHGESKKGLKWAPLLMVASFAMFFICRFLVDRFLGAMI